MAETKAQGRARRIARFRERMHERNAMVGELSLAVAVAQKRLDDALREQMFDQSMIDSLEQEEADAKSKRNG